MRSLLRMKIVRLALVVAVVGLAGVTTTEAFASTHGFRGHGPQTGRAYPSWPGRSAWPGRTATATAGPTGGATPTATPSASPTGGASPAPTRTTPPPATPAPTRTATPAPTATSAGVVNAVLAHINELRASNGLPPYTLSSGLIASAHAHNVLMVNGCGLSHQCAGEASLGDRISAQGVRWTALGENIGYGGGVANTDAAIAASANGLTTSMYNETPPNDGHRKNLLSSTYTHVGIDVVRDGSGTVWLTQDFSN